MRKRCPREVPYDMKCRPARNFGDRSFPGTKSRGSCQLDDPIGDGLVFGGGEVKPVKTLQSPIPLQSHLRDKLKAE
jgi:hypothetical protein